jgi:hypothetical protein
MADNPTPDFETTAQNLGIPKEEFIRDWVGVILSKFMPTVVDQLLSKEILDKNRLSDLEYVWNTVSQHPGIVEEIGVIISIEGELLQAAKVAVDADQRVAALTLIASSIEHRLSLFFLEVLRRSDFLTDPQIAAIIRSDTASKLDWLLVLIARRQLPGRMQERIQQVIDLRDGLIFYHTVANRVRDTQSGFYAQLQNLDFSTLLTLPEEFDQVLREILSESFPGQKLAAEIIDSLLTANQAENAAST